MSNNTRKLRKLKIQINSIFVLCLGLFLKQIFWFCENYDFLRENLIFANFYVYFQCIQVSEGALTLWSHSDVIWSSMVLILVSMDKGGPYLYTGTKYSRIRRSVYNIQGGGCSNPPSEDVLQKYIRRTKVIVVCSHHILIPRAQPEVAFVVCGCQWKSISFSFKFQNSSLNSLYFRSYEIKCTYFRYINL